MKATEIFGSAYIIQNEKFEDERGFFVESFNLKKFRECIDFKYEFVQDNHSKSKKDVLRGLHYQIEHEQGKLVRCIQGEVLDVIVDLRKNSLTFGKWFSIKLNQYNNIQLLVPPGFAHGFYTLTDTAEFIYKTTDYYYPEYERTLIWNDKTLNINWCLNEIPILSKKDLNGKTFENCLIV